MSQYVRNLTLENIVNGMSLDPIENTIESTDGTPWATHEGKLKINGWDVMEVLQLNTGERFITDESMEKVFGKEHIY